MNNVPKIVTLTLNAAIDVTLNIPCLRDNSTIRISNTIRKLGGKGINVSSVCAQQNFQTAAFGPLHHTAHSYLAEGIENHFLPVDYEPRMTFAIRERNRNNTIIINEEGHPLKENYEALLLKDLSKYIEAHPQSVLVISGSLPPGFSNSSFEELVALGGRKSAYVIVDTSKSALKRACLAGADLVKPNEAELVETCGHTDIRKGMRELLDLGAKSILLSRGSEGFIWTNGAQTHSLRYRSSVTGNPTGAGDALVAGMATSRIDGLGIEDSLNRAMIWSVAAVEAPDAGNINLRLPWSEYQKNIEYTIIS